MTLLARTEVLRRRAPAGPASIRSGSGAQAQGPPAPGRRRRRADATPREGGLMSRSATSAHRLYTRRGLASTSSAGSKLWYAPLRRSSCWSRSCGARLSAGSTSASSSTAARSSGVRRCRTSAIERGARGRGRAPSRPSVGVAEVAAVGGDTHPGPDRAARATPRPTEVQTRSGQELDVADATRSRPFVGPSGAGHHQQGAQRPGRLPGAWWSSVIALYFRVADGGRRDRRAAARPGRSPSASTPWSASRSRRRR